jgi:hypothetical protein
LISPKTPNLYAYPIVGRFGLGHSLLAWARCVVWSAEHGARRVAPQWLQPRIGPYLRQERDKRFYHALFHSGSQVGGLRRLYLLATAQKIDIAKWNNKSLAYQKPVIVTFENLNTKNEATYLHEILGHSALVHDALMEMTRPSARPQISKNNQVAIHVRGGDFAIVTDPSRFLTNIHNLRLPIKWYCEMLQDLRSKLGRDLPAIVYSDCSDMELAELLALPNVIRTKIAGAVTDLLAIAQASVLISSGCGFSRWGSYLGQVQRVCHPGQGAFRIIDARSDLDLEPECGGKNIETSIEFVKQRLCAAPRVI